jgi:CubicO group peptidase (beta-lactamase class C family)
MKKSSLVLLLFLGGCSILIAQNQAFVKDEGITTPLHRAHVGQITFMGKPIPIEQYKEADFLDAFEIQPKTDLNMRTFLDRSLTNYLHDLAPNLTADELVQKGNFEFTFRVDEQVVYVEKLVPGAGSPVVKNEKTVFRTPLISSTNEDSWGRFLWNRFLMSGGQEALSGEGHILQIEMRPYVAAPEMKIGPMMASGKLEVKVATQKVNPKAVVIQPLRSTKDIPASKAYLDRDRIQALNTKIAEGTFKNVTSIVVLRDDSLLLEEYFNGASSKTLHDTRSVGKSLTAIMMGFALRDKHIANIDLTLGELYDLSQYAQGSPQKAKIKIRDLLSMSSGLAGSDMDPDSPGNEEKMYPSPDWVRFTLNLPMADNTSPGQQWNYLTAGVVVLGDILNKAVPGGLERYADAKLFAPLGIKKYKWQYTPQKVANTAGGIRMRSIDLAKIGRFCANGGKITDRVTLPDNWMRDCMIPQFPLPDRPEEGYGYLFWHKTYHCRQKEYPVSYMSGNGGNKVFIFENQRLVIVVTATAYNTPYGHSQVDKIVEQHLLPAIFGK